MERKSQAKLERKAQEAEPKQEKPADFSTIFVGDDTGLLKKLSMALTLEDDIISVPSQRKYGKRTFTEQQVDSVPEKEELKEEALIRQRPTVSFKLSSKSGQQAKDEGLLYLQWSLQASHQAQICSDYISYVRGKSNVVQVFDT